MKTIEKLNQKIKAAMRYRDCGMTSAFLKMVKSEIINVGKNAGNRETTEDEAVQAVKRQIKQMQGTIGILEDAGNRQVEISDLKIKIKMLDDLLPMMATRDEVAIFLNEKFPTGGVKKGDAMKALREKFGSLVDMRMAGEVYGEIFN